MAYLLPTSSMPMELVMSTSASAPPRGSLGPEAAFIRSSAAKPAAGISGRGSYGQWRDFWPLTEGKGPPPPPGGEFSFALFFLKRIPSADKNSSPMLEPMSSSTVTRSPPF